LITVKYDFGVILFALMFDKTDKVFFGIALASIMILGAFSFSNNLLPEADAAAFAKYDGIDGESTDSGHSDGWSNVESFSFGVAREMSASTGDRTTSTAHFSDFTIVKQLDKASPKLFLASANGQVIPTFSFEITNSQYKSAYLKYELTNVMITSYSISGGGDEFPTESISLNFEKIKFTYVEQTSKGGTAPVESSWDVVKAEGG